MIELINVTKIYNQGKQNKCCALENVNLILPDNGMVFVVGASGSSKSTMMNIIGGLDNPTNGNVKWNGIELTSKSINAYRANHISIVFQQFNLIKGLSVSENIRLTADINGINLSDEKVNSVLQTVGLVGYGGRQIDTLSGGEEQRVAIARALLREPNLLLADEPTGNLDTKNSAQVFDILKDISRSKAVVVISHDVDAAEKYGDRIITLSDGKILSDLTKNCESSGGDVLNAKYVNEDFVEKLNSHKYSAVSIKNNLQYSPTPILRDDSERKGFSDKKAAISARLSAKLAFTKIKNHKLRFLMSLVFVILTFTLFGTSFSMGQFNVGEVSATHMERTGTKSVLLSKYKSYPPFDYASYKPYYMSNEDLVKLADLLGQEEEFLTKSRYYTAIYTAKGFAKKIPSKKLIFDSDDMNISYSYLENKINGETVSGESSTLMRPSVKWKAGKATLGDNELLLSKAEFTRQFKENFNPSKEYTVSRGLQVYDDVIYRKSYIVAGIIKNVNLDYFESERVVVYNDSEFKYCTFKNAVPWWINYQLPKSHADKVSIINILDENGFFHLGQDSDSLYYGYREVSLYKNVFLLIAAIMLVISIVVLADFIYSNIKDKQNDIGVLQALGLSSGQTVKIFAMQLLLIAVIVVPAVIGGIFVFNSVINSIVTTGIATLTGSSGVGGIIFIGYPILAFAVTTVSLLGAIALASMLPLLLFMRTTPASNIRN